MKVAANTENGERNTVAKLLDKLVILKPITAGESPTKFSEGQPTPWCDCNAWFVGRDGTPVPIGSDGGTAVRVWSEVLVPTLANSIGETVAARIIRPMAAYLFDDLNDAEIARCETAEKLLNGSSASFDTEEVF
jgi:hypothetical protein